MKIKCRPEDFRVEEVSQVAPATAGRYTLYRLTKHGIGTIEAVAAINRRWNLAGRRVSYAGLKDRHAWTTQYLTIADGPAQVMTAPQFTLEPVGKLAHPYGPAHIRGNRFVLVLRDLNDDRLERATALVGSLPRDGLPNYFDDQRFGSVGASGEFIAAAWLRGRTSALELALAEPNPFDRSGVKKQKAILRECWGNWPLAKSAPRALIDTQHCDLSGRSPGRFSRRFRPNAPRAALALFLGVSEPLVEHDPHALDRAHDAPRSAVADRSQGGQCGFSSGARCRPG